MLQKLLFYKQILLNELCNKKKLKVLSKLKSIDVARDDLMKSKLDIVILKLSENINEIGIISRSIYRIWKKHHLNESSSLNFQYKTDKINESSANSRTTTCEKSSNKRRSGEIPNTSCSSVKKIRKLSLKDYYKRNNIVKDSTSNVEEITANSGLSFMECITPSLATAKKPVKKLKIPPLPKAHIHPEQPTPIEKENKDIDDNTSKYNMTRRLWKPKSKIDYLASSTNCMEISYFPSNVTEVPSLTQQCQSKLQVYREYIEEVYLTPYFLLKPILVKYSADELLRFESFNQHLIQDNDFLWKKHTLARFSWLNESSATDYSVFSINSSKIIREDRGISWRNRYFREVKAQEDNLNKCLTRFEEKVQKDRENQHKIKVISQPKYNPQMKRPRNNWNQTHSNLSKGSQKAFQMLKNYRSQFSK